MKIFPCSYPFTIHVAKYYFINQKSPKNVESFSPSSFDPLPEYYSLNQHLDSINIGFQTARLEFWQEVPWGGLICKTIFPCKVFTWWCKILLKLANAIYNMQFKWNSVRRQPLRRRNAEISVPFGLFKFTEREVCYSRVLWQIRVTYDIGCLRTFN